MARSAVRTNKRLSAVRQIHAAIAHYRAGDFECAITLASAAEGQVPEPSGSSHLFGRLKARDSEFDFNFQANWLKHGWGADIVEIEDWSVKFWLSRAVSKFRAVYGVGTDEMAELFPWAKTRPH